MWARTAEVMLGVWLAGSPFIFGHASDAVLLWTTDFACAFLVIVISCTAHSVRFRHLHLLNLLPASWLMVAGYAGSAGEAAGAAQNELCVGLLLLMFAIIPSEAALPPVPWRDVRS